MNDRKGFRYRIFPESQAPRIEGTPPARFPAATLEATCQQRPAADIAGGLFDSNRNQRDDVAQVGLFDSAETGGRS